MQSRISNRFLLLLILTLFFQIYIRNSAASWLSRYEFVLLVSFLSDSKFTVKVDSFFQLYIDLFFQLYKCGFIQLTKAFQWQIYLINFCIKKTVLRCIADMWSNPFTSKSRYPICTSVKTVYACVFSFLQILKWFCVQMVILHYLYGRVYKHGVCMLINVYAKRSPFQNYIHFITGKIQFTHYIFCSFSLQWTHSLCCSSRFI